MWDCPWPGGRVSSAAAGVPECRLLIPLTQNQWRSEEEEEGCFEAGGLCLGLWVVFLQEFGMSRVL